MDKKTAKLLRNTAGACLLLAMFYTGQHIYGFLGMYLLITHTWEVDDE